MTSLGKLHCGDGRGVKGSKGPGSTVIKLKQTDGIRFDAK
jgi:hypothetical protein